uniref:Uncharacterized protein n=1 Tax=Anguilla anguilla TaxID=7936 RepID=A0A0E9S2V6_ANGAN
MLSFLIENIVFTKVNSSFISQGLIFKAVVSNPPADPVALQDQGWRPPI